MCDIVFSNGLGVENSEMFGHLFDIQPEAAKFCIFLKSWFELNELKMKNYSFHRMKQCFSGLDKWETTLWSTVTIEAYNNSQSTNNLILIAGYEAHYDNSQRLTDYRIKRLVDFQDEELLEEFFLFYRDYNFRELVISPHYGKSINRQNM